MAILNRQVNAFFNVRKGFLEEKEKQLAALGDGAPAWLHFKPLMYTFPKDLAFDFQSLAFLFEEGHANVVDKLSWAENRYLDLAACVDSFNEAAQELQRGLVNMGIGPNTAFRTADVETRMPDVVAKNSSFARALVLRFDQDEKDYRDAARSMRAALLKTYKPAEIFSLAPEGKFRTIEWSDT